MKKTILCSALLAAISGSALAEEYQIEVGVGLGQTNIELADTEVGIFTAGGEYYFSKVDTDDVPLAEAAFLNQASSVEATYIGTDSDFGTEDTASIGVNFYVPNTILYLGADYTDGSGADGAYSIDVGLAPIKGLLLTTTYVEDVDYDINLQAKYVTDIGSNGQAINVEANVYDGDEETTFGVAADYYFNRTTSVGAVFTDDGSDDDTYGVRARHFFAENVFVGATYSDSDLQETLLLDAGFRF